MHGSSLLLILLGYFAGQGVVAAMRGAVHMRLGFCIAVYTDSYALALVLCT